MKIYSIIISTILLTTSLCAKDVYIHMQENTYQKVSAQPGLDKLIIGSVKAKNNEFSFKINENDLSEFSKLVHTALNRCGGFRTFYSKSELKQFMKPKRQRITKKSLSLIEKEVPSFSQHEKVFSWFDQIERPRMNETIKHLSNYRTRYYKSPEGIASMNWIYEQWAKITAGRSDVTLRKFIHKDFEQPSIILSFKGTEKPEETLVLGGHGDSINTDDGPNGLAPGADDNAAGVALLTELIQLIVKNNYSPKRNVTFIIYAAEEVGVIGSYEITRQYRKNNINVTGVLQFDGVNYQGETFEMALIADLTNQEQNTLLGSLIDEYIKVPWTYQRCNFACSDHAAWNYEGYPASYPVETTADEQNPHFHTKRDTFDKSNFDTIHAEKFLKLAISYLLEKDAI